ncbi:Uncharacterised protein [Mycobacteroides abscessus subsp. abscessus]|nr:Uncharacterised protein [Mycobacteroides abscessus subsp. abscessus]
MHRISAPILDRSMPVLFSARSPAAAAMERSVSSPLIQRRLRMPVRS